MIAEKGSKFNPQGLKLKAEGSKLIARRQGDQEALKLGAEIGTKRKSLRNLQVTSVESLKSVFALANFAGQVAAAGTALTNTVIPLQERLKIL